MRYTAGDVLRHPSHFANWWFELPARRARWWLDVLFEPGQGWLRWRFECRTTMTWHEPPEDYVVAPPLHRAWAWILGDRRQHGIYVDPDRKRMWR